MKIIIKAILFATILTLFSPSLITPGTATTSAPKSASKNANFNLIRDGKGNITEITNLTIDNQRYNIKFIYGSFREIYKSNIAPTFWQNPKLRPKQSMPSTQL